MYRIIPIFLILLVSTVQSQKKRDLLNEIDKLRSVIKRTKQELAAANTKVKSSKTKVATIQRQLEDLQETNSTLLQQMSGFTQLSSQKSKNLETSLVAIKQKDLQLNTIRKVLSETDSTNLSTIGKFKNVIGDQIQMKEGVIFIPIQNTLLFGDSDKSYRIQDKAKPVLKKIAKVLQENTKLSIQVEGNSNALQFTAKHPKNNWELSSLQAAAVVREFENTHKINPKNMKAIGRSSHATAGIETVTKIIIHPEFDAFYANVKESMKGEIERKKMSILGSTQNK